MSYSPHLRTAVLLSGSGTAGVYHAGVLRALHEAGVKIDVVSGRGIGVVGALFAAIDAAPKLWEDGGIWRRSRAVPLYGWRPALQWASVLAITGGAMLVIPLVVLALGLVVYPISFLVQMINVDTGYRLASWYAGFVHDSFSPGALPTVIPRLVTLCVICGVLVLGFSTVRLQRRARTPRPSDRRHWWVRLIGSPWTSTPGVEHFRAGLWELFRGPAKAKEPAPAELSRRYTELLLENIGQPGFRELIVATFDLETRSDLVFAAVGDKRRAAYFRRSQGDLVDFAGVGRNQIFEALAGALSIPVLTDAHVLAFPVEGYWKGETHRTCDRIGAVARLLDELAAAGVEQVILVCADADRISPHRLSRPPASFEARLAEHLAAAEIAAVRDAVVSHRGRFEGLFVIQPTHNPIGPFDVAGAYDEHSDRHRTLTELMDGGYEDAYRQFVEPIVGGGE